MSFADDLRAWSDEELVALFQLRPDLLDAASEGLQAIAARAVSSQSIRRCLVSSDVAMLVVLDALALLGPSTPAEIEELLGVSNITGIIDTLDRLRRSALIRVSDGVVQLLGRVDEVYPAPLGLGPSYRELADSIPPDTVDRLAKVLRATGSSDKSITVAAISRRLRTPQGIADIMSAVPPEAKPVISTMVSVRTDIVQIPGYDTGPGLDPSWGAGEADLDVGVVWLVNHGLLVPVGVNLAVIPREFVVGMAPNGLAPWCALDAVEPNPVQGPEPAVTTADAARAANRLVDMVEAVLAMVDSERIATLKSGGVGARELGRVAKLLDIKPLDAGRIIELAYQCGLISIWRGKLTATTEANGWRIQPRHQRWLGLVGGWLRSPVFLSQVLSRDDRDRQRPAICDNPIVAASMGCRLNVLNMASQIEPGQAWDRDSLAMAAVWLAPNLWGRGQYLQEELVEWNIEEIHLIGLAAHDSPTEILRLLGGAYSPLPIGQLENAAEAMVGHDQDQLIIQADNTAISLGPLKPSVASLLAAMALRNTKADTVSYTFTDDSLVGAFDAGWTGAEIEEFLGRHAMSGVPQPLSYLINDVQRRYGQAKVSAARGVIVADDEAMAARIMAAPESEGLGLSLVAPTILVGQADSDTMVKRLRKAGVLAVVETDAEQPATPPLSPLAQHDLSEYQTHENHLDNKASAEAHQPALSKWLAIPGKGFGTKLDLRSTPSDDEAFQMVSALRQQDGFVAAAGTKSPDSSQANFKDKLDQSQNRPIVVTHLEGDEISTTHGVLLGVGHDAVVLGVAGICSIPVGQIVSVAEIPA